MGAKYNWYIGVFLLELEPWCYVRLTRKKKTGWGVVFEFWV